MSKEVNSSTLGIGKYYNFEFMKTIRDGIFSNIMFLVSGKGLLLHCREHSLNEIAKKLSIRSRCLLC